MRRSFAFRFIPLIALSLAGMAQLRAQDKDPAPPQTLEEFQKAVKDAMDKDHVPGVGLALISHGDLLWCGGVGMADVASKKLVDCDTEFRVGSISKTFVALALLKLQEEGKIDLNAKLGDMAPEIQVKNPWEADRPVRIVNLLEHSAGFDDMEFSEVYNKSGPYDYPLLRVFQRFLEPQEVRWTPSTRMSYSNPGYGIAGYLIEKVSGKPYDQYIRENILDPLEMKTADFRFTEANKARLSIGYGGNPPQAVGYPFIYLRPAGDLKASPAELAKLVQFFLRRGNTGETQLLKPETIERMETPKTTSAAQRGLRLGYGLANYTRVMGDVVTHGHDGGIDGFVSSYRYMPEQNWGYVALLNNASSGEAFEKINELAIAFLSKGFAKPYKPLAPAPPADLQALAGFYVPRAPRSQLLAFVDDLTGPVRMRVLGGQLMRSGLFGKPSVLLPVGKNLFREEKEPEGTTLFFEGEAGRLSFTAEGLQGVQYAERISPAWPYTRLVLLILGVVLMLSALLFAIVWIVLKVLGKMKDVRHLSVRVVPLLAVLAFLSIPFAASRLSGAGIGEVNLPTLGIFLGTLLFPLLSLLALVLVLRVPKGEVHRGVWIHSLLVSVACCGIAGYLASWGVFAVRLWAAR